MCRVNSNNNKNDCMKDFKKRTLLALVLAIVTALPAVAQELRWKIVDQQTGEGIPFSSAVYRGHHVSAKADSTGYLVIERHEGWTITISAVGYRQKNIKINSKAKEEMEVKLVPDSRKLGEVVVKTKRKRGYSRKNNPAVELMKRVIEAKKRTDLSNHDYYRLNKYQKITLSINDIKPIDMDSGFFSKKQWLLDQIETSPYNDKLILPLSVDETVSQRIYRKNPKSEKNIIIGQQSNGINQLIETGDILNTALKDVFTDVDIYDDYVRLLQYPFPSPIGKTAISFYHFYIVDTVKVDRDSCFHMEFVPANIQDFGFRGELYILKDSTLHVKKCALSIPKRSDVNFVDNLQIRQEYTQLPNGEWVLSTDDMMVELSLAKIFRQFLVTRTTRLTDYAFDPLPDKLFKGKAKERREADAMMRDEAFWKEYRQVDLTKSESSMDGFIKQIQNLKGFKFVAFGIRALIENFVETSHPSKIDIGPVNTMISRNFIDGWRTRVSAQTTANLNKHWFAAGYIARGWGSHKNYYKGELIYSFKKKEYLPREFPRRTLSFLSTYDVTSPSDKFIHTDKDNVFTAFKWAKVDKMMFYNRQQLSFEWEEDWGFKTLVAFKTEKNEPVGALTFVPLNSIDGLSRTMRTTELRAELRLEPGRTYINTKQRRIPINLDAPVFTLSHTMGIKGFLGGQYNYNLTELGVYKRFWMGSWGKVDAYLKAGQQWNTVPFPLLIMPAANLSYIIQDETFNLVNNMEFLNDRYASLHVSWDLNGKLLNRVPLIKRLKWREYLGVKCLWGYLSDKNNPFLPQNAGSDVLMYFPEGCYVMDWHRPYVEIVAGIHNIFKILHVEYVRRLNYNNLPTAHKHGVRFMVRMTF